MLKQLHEIGPCSGLRFWSAIWSLVSNVHVFWLSLSQSRWISCCVAVAKGVAMGLLCFNACCHDDQATAAFSDISIGCVRNGDVGYSYWLIWALSCIHHFVLLPMCKNNDRYWFLLYQMVSDYLFVLYCWQRLMKMMMWCHPRCQWNRPVCSKWIGW